MGRMLVGIGLVIVLMGALLWAGERLFGRSGGLLPGDIVVRKGNFTFFFPIVSCIILSVLLTLFFRLFGDWRGPR